METSACMEGTAHSAEEGRRDQDLFFEVSKKVESAEMLQGWFEWFRALNIPCAITKSRRGYALWRKGEEVGRKRSKARPELTKQKIIFSYGL